MAEAYLAFRILWTRIVLPALLGERRGREYLAIRDVDVTVARSARRAVVAEH